MIHHAPQLPLPGAQVPAQAPAFTLEAVPAVVPPREDRATGELFTPADLQRPPAQDLTAWLARQTASARAKIQRARATVRKECRDLDPITGTPFVA